MSAWTALSIVVLVAVMTYAMRAGVIVALAGRSLPVPVERALRYVGPSVLAALAINLAAGGEGAAVGLTVAEGAALVAAGAVAWWRRNVIWSLLAGMAVLWISAAVC